MGAHPCAPPPLADLEATASLSLSRAASATPLSSGPPPAGEGSGERSPGPRGQWLALFPGSSRWKLVHCPSRRPPALRVFTSSVYKERAGTRLENGLYNGNCHQYNLFLQIFQNDSRINFHDLICDSQHTHNYVD